MSRRTKLTIKRKASSDFQEKEEEREKERNTFISPPPAPTPSSSSSRVRIGLANVKPKVKDEIEIIDVENDGDGGMEIEKERAIIRDTKIVVTSSQSHLKVKQEGEGEVRDRGRERDIEIERDKGRDRDRDRILHIDRGGEKEEEKEGVGQEGYLDCTNLPLKKKSESKPLWVCPVRMNASTQGQVNTITIYLESFSPFYNYVYDFLIAIGEPVSRPTYIHQYQLTPQSLYAAAATNYGASDVIEGLNKFSKNELDSSVIDYVKKWTATFGKAKLVLRENQYFVEADTREIGLELLENDIIREARILEATERDEDGFTTQKKAKERRVNRQFADVNVDVIDLEGDDSGGVGVGLGGLDGETNMNMNINQGGVGDEGGGNTNMSQEKGLGGGLGIGIGLDEDDEDDDEDDNEEAFSPYVVSFKIERESVSNVKRAAMEMEPSYPLMEEYDFAKDVDPKHPDLPIERKLTTQIRPYQLKCLDKIFGNKRARSGIIVLPCGAGKTLTGIMAATRIHKSTIVVCINNVSAIQWQEQFKLFTTIDAKNIRLLIAKKKEKLPENPEEACILITTYSMLSPSENRNDESRRILKMISQRQWGLMLLDEVHQALAPNFAKIVELYPAHTKLGFTATLVREDENIEQLNFMIGPKLYEANWMDLTRMGYLANVQCAEVWCPMSYIFYRHYLSHPHFRKALYKLNSNKLLICQYLVRYHEDRGDKILIMSENLSVLKECHRLLNRPQLYGGTSEADREQILRTFRLSPKVNTIILSNIGDTAIDLPEASVVIQISAQFGSRRQEAQRLGRILRPKQSTTTSGENKFSAFFYTLVSTETPEIYHNSRRQRYLVDQGYNFKIIPDMLHEAQQMEDPCMNPEEERKILRKILNKEYSERKDTDDDDGSYDLQQIPVGPRAIEQAQARRGRGDISNISGGRGLNYQEYGAERYTRR